MENLVFGLEVMFVGFTVVMITLYLLYLILLGFSKCFVRPAKAEPLRENNPIVSMAAAEQAASVSTYDEAALLPFGAGPEIVAVITAGISFYFDSISPSASQYKIVSVQPALSGSNSSPWAVAGRKRLMEKRQDLAMFRRERMR